MQQTSKNLQNGSIKGITLLNGNTNIPTVGQSKYDAPCRYWKFGTCKMGDHCRFSHSEPLDEEFIQQQANLRRSMDSNISMGSSRSSSFSLDTTCSLGFDLSNTFFSRRPFVHVIVLYAGGVGVLTVPQNGHSEGKVSSFAREVCHHLSEASIDYYFHCRMNSTHFIRTENLSEIIGHFKADHLIVIGDRNMKNRTIQVRRRAKLVEMSVEEAISYVWSEIEILDSSSHIDLYNLLERYSGVRHYKERIEKLKLDLEELDKLRSSDLSFAKHNAIESHWAFSLSDVKGEIPLSERVTLKLTQIQKVLIRNHQQLSDVAEKMEAEQEEGYCRKGVEILDSNTNANNLLPTIGINRELHSILYDFVVNKLLRFLEHNIIRQKLFVFSHALFLWNNYYEEYTSNSTENQSSNETNREVDNFLVEWDCPLCHSSNSQYDERESVLHCNTCNSPFPSDGNDELLWLIAGKTIRKANRQKRELKEKEEQNQFKQNHALFQPRKNSNLRKSEERENMYPYLSAISSKVNLENPGHLSGWREQSNQGLTRSNSMSAVSAWIRPPSIISGTLGNYSSSEVENTDRRSNVLPQYAARSAKSLDSVPLVLPPNWDLNREDEIYRRSLSLHDEYADDFSHFTNHRGLMQDNRSECRKGLNSSQELEESEIDHLLSVPPSPTKPFSDLWSDSSSPNSSYLSLPSASFHHEMSFSSSEENSNQNQSALSISSPSLRLVDQGIHLLFREEEMEEREDHAQMPSERPCMCCGNESFIECTYCARFGLPPTYFCSSDHQSLMWKQHSILHHQSEQSTGYTYSLAEHNLNNKNSQNWVSYNPPFGVDAFHYHQPNPNEFYSSGRFNFNGNHFGSYQSHSPSGVFT